MKRFITPSTVVESSLLNTELSYFRPYHITDTDDTLMYTCGLLQLCSTMYTINGYIVKHKHYLLCAINTTIKYFKAHSVMPTLYRIVHIDSISRAGKENTDIFANVTSRFFYKF